MVDESDESPVGYARPPARTQFKKGRSGNPRGRPKANRGIDALLDEILSETLTVNENGRRTKVNKLKLVIKQLVNKAAAGDLKAGQLVLSTRDRLDTRVSAKAAPNAPLSETDEIVLKHLQDLYFKKDDTGGAK